MGMRPRLITAAIQQATFVVNVNFNHTRVPAQLLHPEARHCLFRCGSFLALLQHNFVVFITFCCVSLTESDFFKAAKNTTRYWKSIVKRALDEQCIAANTAFPLLETRSSDLLCFASKERKARRKQNPVRVPFSAHPAAFALFVFQTRRIDMCGCLSPEVLNRTHPQLERRAVVRQSRAADTRPRRRLSLRAALFPGSSPHVQPSVLERKRAKHGLRLPGKADHLSLQRRQYALSRVGTTLMRPLQQSVSFSSFASV